MNQALLFNLTTFTNEGLFILAQGKKVVEGRKRPGGLGLRPAGT
jgi:hypothetical protein